MTLIRDALQNRYNTDFEPVTLAPGAAIATDQLKGYAQALVRQGTIDTNPGDALFAPEFKGITWELNPFQTLWFFHRLLEKIRAAPASGPAQRLRQSF